MAAQTFIGQFFHAGALEFAAGSDITAPPTAVDSATLDTNILAQQDAAPEQALGQSKQNNGGQLVQPAPANTLNLSGLASFPEGTKAGMYLSTIITDTTTGDTLMSSSQIITADDMEAGGKAFSLGGSTGLADTSTLSVDIAITPDTGLGPKSGNPVPVLTTARIDTFAVAAQ